MHVQIIIKKKNPKWAGEKKKWENAIYKYKKWKTANNWNKKCKRKERRFYKKLYISTNKKVLGKNKKERKENKEIAIEKCRRTF